MNEGRVRFVGQAEIDEFEKRGVIADKISGWHSLRLI